MIGFGWFKKRKSFKRSGDTGADTSASYVHYAYANTNGKPSQLRFKTVSVARRNRPSCEAKPTLFQIESERVREE